MNKLPDKKLASYYASTLILCWILIVFNYSDVQWLKFVSYWMLKLTIWLTILTGLLIMIFDSHKRLFITAGLLIGFILATVFMFNKIHGVYIVETNYIMETVDQGNLSWTRYHDLIDELRPYYRAGVKKAYMNGSTLSEYNTKLGKLNIGDTTDTRYIVKVLGVRYLGDTTFFSRENKHD